MTDPSTQVARIAVVERHRRTGRIGLGYVRGFGLTSGAIASTVAHDAHNCMVVGALDQSGPAEMAVAVARLAEIGGGQVAVRRRTSAGRGSAAHRRAHERPEHRGGRQRSETPG